MNLQDQVFWYHDKHEVIRCLEDMHADVVIIGGGIAGLSAADAWHKRGKKVVLVEQWHCGSGATGKSSGFITPNAEISLTDFAHRYNKDIALQIWDLVARGVESVRSNIKEHNFICDYQEQDTLVLANKLKDLKQLEQEHHNLLEFGFQSKFYTQKDINAHIGSKKYFGGVVYEDSFGINGYQYCQEMRKYLQAQGVFIFEETPALQIQDHTVITPHAKITAEYIVVCTDRFAPELGVLKQDVYHGQTFIIASEQLSDEQVKMIFPNKNLMCWDTDLIYQYFRVTGDNRLLLGGGNFVSTYATKQIHDYQAMRHQLTSYCQYKFPDLSINFEYMWPGFMGISKDVAPLAGTDKDKPYIYYISAAAGLPIAAAFGIHSAQRLLDGNDQFDEYFSPYRKFFISGWLQSLLGNPLSFMLSNIIKKNIP